ncbi:FecR family protein [Sunxiuqinia sp. A32]|uniref:FecR family protein n=1 Tax=Sunxiuqinia sp. A32 TaxID=3461496 RepID=UPI004045EF00
MNDKNRHINLAAIDNHSKRFFANGTFQWNKSQYKVWQELDVLAIEQKSKSISLSNYRTWAVAASILLLVGLGSFLRFYSVKIEIPSGIHQMADLPDGSTVELNANSTLQYYPYWWKMQRIVKMEGEGFFNVEKGKKFIVASSGGKTQVLGTSFNIYSRDDHYKVTCITGSVKVTSRLREEVILKPNSKVEITKDGDINIKRDIETYPEISWRKNIFLFSATPAGNVFKEIERQYDIRISVDVDDYVLYTGNFSKEQNVEDVLGYVCPALGLKFIKKSPGIYDVIEDSE